MKNFRQTLMAIAMVVGLAFSVSAQKDDQKRPPKNPDRPKIEPKEKPPRGNPPKGDDRPKKPEMSFFLVSKVHDNEIA